MRSLSGFLAIGMVIFLGTSLVAADTQEDVDQTVQDVLRQLHLAQGSDTNDGDADSSSDDDMASSSHAILREPNGAVEQLQRSILDLGMGLVAGLFAGVTESAQVFATAANTVSQAPPATTVSAGAALGVLGLLAWLGLMAARVGSIAAVPLFSRISKNELLDNKIRADMFQLIQANPGINASELARRMNIAWGTATHHLHKLRQERLVAIRLQAHQKCYFANGGTYTPHEMDVLTATKHPTAKRIAEFLVQNGPRCHRDISQSLGLSPALVSFHVSKLVELNLITRRRDGRRTIFEPLEMNLEPQPRPVVHAV